MRASLRTSKQFTFDGEFERLGSRRRKSFVPDIGAAKELRSFLESCEGSALKAWIKHFDLDQDGRVTKQEFEQGLRQMEFDGSPQRLFALLDFDGSGDITLEEIDGSQSIVWQRFRIWCAKTFSSVDDMVEKLLDTSGPDFETRLAEEGWDGGCADLLKAALAGDRSRVTESLTTWFDIEQRKAQQKERSKQKGLQSRCRKTLDSVAAVRDLSDLKRLLIRKYGGLVRAWRCCLSLDDSMVLHKAEFLKACTRINGWQGNAKLVWKALDRDDSGLVSIDELDPQCAEILARFQAWSTQHFGSASATFKAIDVLGSGKIAQVEFVERLKTLGFAYPAKSLFHGLDRGGKKALMEENLLFLDRWKPLPFLVAEPNEEALDEVRTLLLGRYKSWFAAWRRLLDKDSVNRAGWFEWVGACKKVGFDGDVAGAWRAADADCSGYISIEELDPDAAEILFEFKRWADAEFGGVRSAFTSFDVDNSKQIDFREFRSTCRLFGFEGCIPKLFELLDVKRDGTLTLQEVVFLDDWPGDAQLIGDAEDMRRCSTGTAADRRSSMLQARGSFFRTRGSTLVSIDSGLGQQSEEQRQEQKVSRTPSLLVATTPATPRGGEELPHSLKLLERRKSVWRARGGAMSSGARIRRAQLAGQPSFGAEVDFAMLSRAIRGVDSGGDGASSVDGDDFAWWELPALGSAAAMSPRTPPVRHGASVTPAIAPTASQQRAAAGSPPRTAPPPETPVALMRRGASVTPAIAPTASQQRVAAGTPPRTAPPLTAPLRAGELLEVAYGEQRWPPRKAPPTAGAPQVRTPQPYRGLGAEPTRAQDACRPTSCAGRRPLLCYLPPQSCGGRPKVS